MVLVAPFSDVERLTATYRLAGTIPILSPLARYPPLLTYLNNFIADKWDSKARIASLIQSHDRLNHAPESSSNDGARYHITIIHAEDDYDIHYSHIEQLFWHAVNATTEQGISYEDLEQVKATTSTDLGEGGRAIEWRGRNGVVRQQICKHGLHDRIMGYPVVSLAIMRACANGAGVGDGVEQPLLLPG